MKERVCTAVGRALSTSILVLLLVDIPPPRCFSVDEWSPPANLSGWEWNIGISRLKLGDDGTAAAFWEVENASGQTLLRARVRPPGGAWGLPEDVSGPPVSFPAVWPPLWWDGSVAADGTVWVVWVGYDAGQSGDNVFVMASRLPPGGSWQTEQLTTFYEGSIVWIDLDAGPDGDLAAAWVGCASATDPANSACHVRLRRRPSGASAWELPDQPDEAMDVPISQSNLLVGPGGLTAVLWLQADAQPATAWALMARVFEPTPAPGAWEPSPINVSDWKQTLSPAWPVMDPGGTITAAWIAPAADAAKQAVFASTRAAPGGTWSAPPTAVSTERAFPSLSYTRLAAGQDGTVAAAWLYRASATEQYVFVNARDAGSIWGTETQLFGGPGFELPGWNLRLGVGPNGTATALFECQNTSHHPDEDATVRWSARPPHGGWGDGGQGELGGWASSITSVDLAVGGDGSFTAVWGTESAGRPPGEQWAVLAAVRPPEGFFEPPVAVTGWQAYTVWPGGLVAGRDGRPVVAAWYGQRPDDNLYALYASEFKPQELRFYLPLVLRNR